MAKSKYITYLFFLLSFTTFKSYGQKGITISGNVFDNSTNEVLPYVNVVALKKTDSSFITGGVTDTDGLFKLINISSGDYIIQASFIGYQTFYKDIFVGTSSQFLNIGEIKMVSSEGTLGEVVIETKQDEVKATMEKKSFKVDDNITRSGGSLLQAMQNLPGITIQDGQVQLRGSSNLIILIDGKQSALTGIGGQSGLDNIPASSIERIEIINNPSSKYSANGNAGIINIILKKESKEGLTGKIGLTGGLGALWIKKQNLPTIRPQYQNTPKVNPSVFLNYRKKKINLFIQADNLYTHTLNKNEFVTRKYTDGTIINQQTVRNRNTNFFNGRIGMDYHISQNDELSVSGVFGSESILDNGDEPFFNGNTNERIRLWRFVEDEVKTTVNALANYTHKFKQPGRLFSFKYSYTFHRENEQYTFNNILPLYSGVDAFKMISNESIHDFQTDYIHPLKNGILETGVKFRYRDIPINMKFYPGYNSPLDSNAGGWARYNEIIPAAYGNYKYETKKIEAQLGMRVEYVKLNYLVNPNHPTYSSNGYNYFQPFPNMRLSYKFNDRNRLALFINRRVDRPREVDIRIFPKYDDAEIIKVGNPALRPQFTNKIELGYKSTFSRGYFYAAAYHKMINATITRMSLTSDTSYLIYAVFQNAGKSYNTGLEMVWTHNVSKKFSYSLNVNMYHNQINAFTVTSLYPRPTTFTMQKQEIISGNVKLNVTFKLNKGVDAQFAMIYLAPDIIPQGKIAQRFTTNFGIKKATNKGKGSLFFNATDLFNTMIVKKEIVGNNFTYISSNYYETQVLRIGYSYKF